MGNVSTRVHSEAIAVSFVPRLFLWHGAVLANGPTGTASSYGLSTDFYVPLR